MDIYLEDNIGYVLNDITIDITIVLQLIYRILTCIIHIYIYTYTYTYIYIYIYKIPKVPLKGGMAGWRDGEFENDPQRGGLAQSGGKRRKCCRD